jgi:hypothetical protein
VPELDKEVEKKLAHNNYNHWFNRVGPSWSRWITVSVDYRGLSVDYRVGGLPGRWITVRSVDYRGVGGLPWGRWITVGFGG